MIVRDATPDDIPALVGMHNALGSEYPWPDLYDGTFMAVQVVESDGTPVMAAMARRTAEAFLLLDPSWATPGFRFEAMRSLEAAAMRRLAELHVNDCHALIPPMVERRFGRRLEKMGWWHPTWPLYARKVG